MYLGGDGNKILSLLLLLLFHSRRKKVKTSEHETMSMVCAEVRGRTDQHRKKEKTYENDIENYK